MPLPDLNRSLRADNQPARKAGASSSDTPASSEWITTSKKVFIDQWITTSPRKICQSRLTTLRSIMVLVVFGRGVVLGRERRSFRQLELTKHSLQTSIFLPTGPVYPLDLS
jgi:hypothetical protein